MGSGDKITIASTSASPIAAVRKRDHRAILDSLFLQLDDMEERCAGCACELK